jgi:hypothetical protein
VRPGRVVRIFDKRRIAVNLGANDGIVQGDQFDIYTPDTDVIDPQTGTNLGSYRRRKATVYAREVFPLFSIGYPADRRVPIEEPIAALSAASALFQPTRYRTERGEAPVDARQIEEVPTGTRVQVGDIVEVSRKEGEEATAEVSEPDAASP